MFDFLILTPKIFTRNKPQVKVTLPLQALSKHQSHREKDFMLDFNRGLTIDLCYGSARQSSSSLVAILLC
jgi:hypothetical protein